MFTLVKDNHMDNYLKEIFFEFCILWIDCSIVCKQSTTPPPPPHPKKTNRGEQPQGPTHAPRMKKWERTTPEPQPRPRTVSCKIYLGMGGWLSVRMWRWEGWVNRFYWCQIITPGSSVGWIQKPLFGCSHRGSLTSSMKHQGKKYKSNYIASMKTRMKTCGKYLSHWQPELKPCHAK